MARPTREESIYRISIHRNGGYMYASTHPYAVTPEGKRKYAILHWGIVDKNMKFIPGPRYLYASHEERSKLIFPEDWDMSLACKLSGKLSQGRPSYDGDDLNRFYGDVWLLEQVALKTGIRQDPRRDAFYPLHRAQGKSQVHHPFRGFTAGNLQGLRLRSAGGLRSNIYF